MANQKEIVNPWTRQAIETFLFSRGHHESTYAPRGLDRGTIVAYLEYRLELEITATPARRVRQLCDAYDLVEAVAVLEKHIDDAPKEEDDFVRSMAFSAARAELGDDPQRTTSAEHYDKTLLAHIQAPDHFPELIEMYAVLGPDYSSDSLKSVIELQLKQLEPRIESDYTTRIEHLEAQALLNNDVPEAEEAVAIKRKILGQPDVAARVKEWANVYLGIDYGGGPYLEPWAVRMLRRAGADEPEPVAKALRDVLPKIEKQKLPRQEMEFLRRRSLRAIEFFGGALDEKEGKFLDRFVGSEDCYDELSNQ